MKKHRTESRRGIARLLADALTRNFALKLLSLLLAIMIYFFLKPNAVTTTPAVEKMAKAIAAGAGMETAPEPAATNAVDAISAPATNRADSASAPGAAGAPETKSNGKD